MSLFKITDFCRDDGSVDTETYCRGKELLEILHA